MERFTSAGLLGLLAGSILSAQPTQFRAPLSGFVYDPPSKSIRAVLGIPGAAWLARPSSTGLAFASVAPDGRFAIAVHDGRVWAVRLPQPGGEPGETPIETTLVTVDRVAWAPDSSVAALYSLASRSIQVLSFSADSAATGEVIDVPGELAALAVAGENLVVAGLRTGEAGGIYLLSANSPPVEVLSMAAPAAMTTGDGGRTLYAACGSGEVYALRGLGAVPEISLVLAHEEGLREPAGIAALPHGRLLVAGAGPVLRLYDLASRTVISEIPLDAAPATLEPLADGDVFLLNTRSGPAMPLLVFDSRASAVFFVPAGEEE